MNWNRHPGLLREDARLFAKKPAHENPVTCSTYIWRKVHTVNHLRSKNEHGQYVFQTTWTPHGQGKKIARVWHQFEGSNFWRQAFKMHKIFFFWHKFSSNFSSCKKYAAPRQLKKNKEKFRGLTTWSWKRDVWVGGQENVKMWVCQVKTIWI
jgi:hypothetical protein